jgi:hypothetical protein
LKRRTSEPTDQRKQQRDKSRATIDDGKPAPRSNRRCLPNEFCSREYSRPEEMNRRISAALLLRLRPAVASASLPMSFQNHWLEADATMPVV